MSHEAAQLAEDTIPELAMEAFRRAFLQARSSGQPVVAADGGILCEIQPDGTRREIKTLLPHVPATIGATISLR